LHGLELSRRFYLEAVRPILERHFHHLDHAAALIGPGSEVLGYDDETSRDHHWGPRLQLFLGEADAAEGITQALADELPVEFSGFPTNFGQPDEIGVRLLVPIEEGPVAHLVEARVLHDFLLDLVGVDPLEGFTTADWLVTPTQRLLELTAGAVFADSTGDLTRVRELLSWYPHDVWLLVMAGYWARIGELEHVVGRTASRGDALGSRVVAASLVRDLMRLALVQARRYPPYWKWLGTAYGSLGRPEAPALDAALAAPDRHAREEALVNAYEHVARAHNELAVTDWVDPQPRQFYGREFYVLFADRFADACRDAIADPEVRALGHGAGAIDTASDNTAVLTRPTGWRRLTGLYAGF
jgi:Domain of unknown function (DUF4037)